MADKLTPASARPGDNVIVFRRAPFNAAGIRGTLLYWDERGLAMKRSWTGVRVDIPSDKVIAAYTGPPVICARKS